MSTNMSNAVTGKRTVKVRIPVVVESAGLFQAIEVFDGEAQFGRALADAHVAAKRATGTSNVARVVVIEAEVECPEYFKTATVQGTVTL